MSLWSDVTHAGSFVKSTVNKGKTIYTATMHDVSDVFGEAGDPFGLGSFESDITDGIEHATQFMVTKANGLVKHYIDSDGDGIFKKGVDELIGKVKMPTGSFFSDLDGEAHSIFGNAGVLYSHGTEAASELYQNHLGWVPTVAEDLPGALGNTGDDILHGLQVVASFAPLFL